MNTGNNVNSTQAYCGSRVLVLGASGFIGRWVARMLTLGGANLWIAGRNKDKLSHVAEEYGIQGNPLTVDFMKPGEFGKLFMEIKPDIVFNLTGYGVSRNETDMSTAWRINTGLVEEIALAVAHGSESEWKGMKFVHVGSGFEYGSIPGVVCEDSVPDPVNLYGKTKLAGTLGLKEICGRNRIAAVTARVFTAYGPGEPSSRLLPSILHASRSGETLNLTTGLQRRDFTYVKDIASGLLKLGLTNYIPGSIVNLATGTLVSVRDFAECAGRSLNIDPSRLLFGAIPCREDEVRQERVDVSLLRRSVDWVPTCSIAEGIIDTIAFEKSRGFFN